MNLEAQNTFSAIIDQFLAQHCKHGTGLHISDRALFTQFRAFWMARTRQSAHPALLGQYRVELTERGYRSHGGKRPHWYGLALRVDKQRNSSSI